MNPTPEQIRQAMLNHERPPRTMGARIRAALQHCNQKKNPADGPGLNVHVDKANGPENCNPPTAQ